MALSLKEVIAIERLRTRATQCFTLLVWLSKVRPHIRAGNDNGQEIIVMMQNAAIETSLVSFRCLNEFFRQRDTKHRKNDVIAEDYFGYKSPGPFLSEAESSSLNKRLLHLTYQEEALDAFGWKIAAWTAKGVPQMMAFFRFVAERLPDGDSSRTRIELELPHWQILVDQSAQLALSEMQQVSFRAPK